MKLYALFTLIIHLLTVNTILLKVKQSFVQTLCLTLGVSGSHPVSCFSNKETEPGPTMKDVE